MPVPIDVYDYLDYRLLLRDYYAAKKAEGRGFSYRWFSRRAGLGAPNHLKRVMEGQRNLTADSAAAYARAMGLTGERASYFQVLVRFNQVKTRAGREEAYERMRSFRGFRRAHWIDDSYADYHAHWYVPAIREMALRADFEPDPAWIAPRMMPAIEVREAREALDVLFRLGMLVREDDGRVRQSDPVVTTGEQTRGLHIRRYHRTMLDRAAESIERVPANQRFLGALTFCVGPDGFERINERVQRFRKELIAMLAEEQGGERVLHLGLQLFPLTTAPGEEE